MNMSTNPDAVQDEDIKIPAPRKVDLPAPKD